MISYPLEDMGSPNGLLEQKIAGEAAANLWNDCHSGAGLTCSSQASVDNAVKTVLNQESKANPTYDPFLIATDLDIAVSARQLQMLHSVVPEGKQASAKELALLDQTAATPDFNLSLLLG